MFRRLPDRNGSGASTDQIMFTYEGRQLAARPGDSVMAALLANGIKTCRSTPVSGALRGPYCMMGICFECLVVVDGVGNRQGCLIPVSQGMTIAQQHGARKADPIRE